MSFFSVVITVYNKAEFIENTLKSVIDQSFKDFEIIVINDGSTDASEEIIKAFYDTRIKLTTTKNQGASIARNTGIEKANYDYIALLDGDDMWHKEYLTSIYNAIDKYPEQKVFSAAVSQKYEQKTVPVAYSFKQDTLHGIHNYFESSKKYSLVTSSSIVFHKSVLDKTGVFDPSIVSGQDVDLWVRFGLHYNVIFINRHLVLYNYNTSSLSNTTYDPSKKPKFDKYFNLEKDNTLLKAYLDMNRYSMAILSKFQNDADSYKYYLDNINLNNLSLRQKILLKSPKWLLKLLQKIRSIKGEKLYYSDN